MPPRWYWHTPKDAKAGSLPQPSPLAPPPRHRLSVLAGPRASTSENDFKEKHGRAAGRRRFVRRVVKALSGPEHSAEDHDAQGAKPRRTVRFGWKDYEQGGPGSIYPKRILNNNKKK